MTKKELKFNPTNLGNNGLQHVESRVASHSFIESPQEKGGSASLKDLSLPDRSLFSPAIVNAPYVKAVSTARVLKDNPITLSYKSDLIRILEFFSKQTEEANSIALLDDESGTYSYEVNAAIMAHAFGSINKSIEMFRQLSVKLEKRKEQLLIKARKVDTASVKRTGQKNAEELYNALQLSATIFDKQLVVSTKVLGIITADLATKIQNQSVPIALLREICAVYNDQASLLMHMDMLFHNSIGNIPVSLENAQLSIQKYDQLAALSHQPSSEDEQTLPQAMTLLTELLQNGHKEHAGFYSLFNLLMLSSYSIFTGPNKLSLDTLSKQTQQTIESGYSIVALLRKVWEECLLILGGKNAQHRAKAIAFFKAYEAEEKRLFTKKPELSKDVLAVLLVQADLSTGLLDIAKLIQQGDELYPELPDLPKRLMRAGETLGVRYPTTPEPVYDLFDLSDIDELSAEYESRFVEALDALSRQTDHYMVFNKFERIFEKPKQYLGKGVLNSMHISLEDDGTALFTITTELVTETETAKPTSTKIRVSFTYDPITHSFGAKLPWETDPTNQKQNALEQTLLKIAADEVMSYYEYLMADRQKRIKVKKHNNQTASALRPRRKVGKPSSEVKDNAEESFESSSVLPTLLELTGRALKMVEKLDPQKRQEIIDFIEKYNNNEIDKTLFLFEMLTDEGNLFKMKSKRAGLLATFRFIYRKVGNNAEIVSVKKRKDAY